MEKDPNLSNHFEPQTSLEGTAEEGILSPEVIESAMGRVRDLYESGYAFTNLRIPQETAVKEDQEGFFEKRLELLESTLEKGLLGVFEDSRRHAGEEWKDKSMTDKFIEFARKERTGVVMGNIIGRDVGTREGESLLGYWGKGISVLYDISNKEEVLPGPVNSDPGSFDRKAKMTKVNEMWARQAQPDFWNRFSNVPFLDVEMSALKKLNILGVERNIDLKELKSEIALNRDALAQESVDVEGLLQKLEKAKSIGDLVYSDRRPGPASDDGFVLGRRIAPRLFTGVLLNVNSRDSFESQNKEDTDKIEAIVAKFSEVSHKTEENRFLPIYDQWGNMWWPKRMSHSEIAKTEEERSARVASIES